MNEKEVKASKEMLDQYLTTALWSSHDYETNMDMDENYDIDDFSKNAIEQSIEDCNGFLSEAKQYLEKEKATDSTIGHDFWLTRNGHGAGFWDGDYIYGIQLTEIAKVYGTVTLFINDKGEVDIL
jgi:hypothetical protein